jgi:hypothetical protein
MGNATFFPVIPSREDFLRIIGRVPKRSWFKREYEITFMEQDLLNDAGFYSEI